MRQAEPLTRSEIKSLFRFLRPFSSEKGLKPPEALERSVARGSDWSAERDDCERSDRLKRRDSVLSVFVEDDKDVAVGGFAELSAGGGILLSGVIRA